MAQISQGLRYEMCSIACRQNLSRFGYFILALGISAIIYQIACRYATRTSEIGQKIDCVTDCESIVD